MSYKKEVRSLAFSLIELSIVLVIISFFVIGISKGQKILKQSAVQATIQQIASLKNSYQEFKTIYFERPGDFSSAHSFFDDGADGICGTTSECNGDGNGIIETDTKSNSETMRAWQHLHLAGFEDTAYDGEWNENNSVPRAKISGSYISFINIGSSFTDNYLKLGTYLSFDNNYSSLGVFIPREAYEIDSKFDDRFPNSGWIKGIGSFDGSSYSSLCTLGEQYLTYYTDSPTCALLFSLE